MTKLFNNQIVGENPQKRAAYQQKVSNYSISRACAYPTILAWKFDCPCMCAVEISWWMVARLEEQLAMAVTSSSCRHLWK